MQNPWQKIILQVFQPGVYTSGVPSWVSTPCPSMSGSRSWLGAPNRSPAGPAHPPPPHPRNERRELLPPAQQGNSRVPSSRRSRGRIGRTVNAVSTCSFNVPTPTNVLPSVITSVVHDHAAPAPVAQYLGGARLPPVKDHRRAIDAPFGPGALVLAYTPGAKGRSRRRRDEDDGYNGPGTVTITLRD